MPFLAFFRSISAKIVTIPVVAFIAGLLIPGLLGYQLLTQGADRETRDRATTALQLLSSVRRTSDDAASQAPPAKGGLFHAGTAAVAQTMRRYEASHHEDMFQYRRALLNPVDPHSQSDEMETQLIRELAANPKMPQAETDITRKGQSFHVMAIPVTVSQDRCLQCHGSSKYAPGWRINRYGRIAGFGWKRGQVVGAEVIYMPSGFPRSQAMAAFWSVGRSIAILAAMCALLLFWRAHYLIGRPVGRMLAASEAIRKGDWQRWSVGWFPDELATLADSFQVTTMHLRNKIVREEKLRALFQQFIPASVAATALGKNAEEVLVGTRHSITVMIINIRNFKLLMDHLPPDQTVSTLNEYFAAVNKVIVANKGLVSKYMGDSVMALFGMPLSKDNHALCAVRAALAIPAALQNLYVRLDDKFGWELGVGIGISTGEPIIGSFGSSEHLEYSVLGDVVAEASYLEGTTKSVPEEDSIVINEPTYRCVMSDVHVMDLGEKERGNGSTIHAYVVQGLRTEVRSSIAA